MKDGLPRSEADDRTWRHPLARDAKIWASGGLSGPSRPILVVVAAVDLSPGHPRDKPKSMERLTAAVRDWIATHPEEASDFVLTNRPKTRAGDRADGAAARDTRGGRARRVGLHLEDRRRSEMDRP